MAEDAGREPKLSVEAELANLVRYMDLYVRQKTDLYVQHYVLEPFDFLVRQLVYLSVLAALLVFGTLAILLGVLYFMETLLGQWWQALLVVGIAALILAGIVAYVLFSSKLILKTPTTEELMKSGKP